LRKLYITDFFPNNYSGGFAISCLEKIKNDLNLDSNIEIFVYVIMDDFTQGCISDVKGYSVVQSKFVGNSRFNSLLRYRHLNVDILNLCNSIKFDHVLVFGDKAFFALPKLLMNLKTILYLGDPYPKISLLRFRYNFKYIKNNFSLTTLNYFLLVLWNYIYFVTFCRINSKKVNKMIYYGAQHFSFWKFICGFKNCELNKSSIESIFEEGINVCRNNSVLILGKLGQIENLYSQQYLVNEFFPYFFTNKDAFKVNFYIIGNNKEAIPKLKYLIKTNSNLESLGFVDNLDDYWYSSKILLVTTTTYLGVRTRIFSAFSKGCVVICHFSCQKSIPQLIDGYNCLICRSGSDFTESIFDILNNDDLFNKIQTGGYNTLKSLLIDEFQ
jgi:hypothetical protein